MIEIPSVLKIARVAIAVMMKEATLRNTLLTVAARFAASVSCACMAVNRSKPLMRRRAIKMRMPLTIRIARIRDPAWIQSIALNQLTTLLSWIIPAPLLRSGNLSQFARLRHAARSYTGQLPRPKGGMRCRLQDGGVKSGKCWVLSTTSVICALQLAACGGRIRR